MAPPRRTIDVFFDSSGVPLIASVNVASERSADDFEFQLMVALFHPTKPSMGFGIAGHVSSPQALLTAMRDTANRKVLTSSQLTDARALANWVWTHKCQPQPQ